MTGKTISHYLIEAQLGQGGMGVVYRARDLTLKRNAAVKFLSSQIADESRRRRFQQEAQTASSLNHPNIVSVFEAGTDDGVQYLITEFIDGYTLDDWVRRERPRVRQIVDIAISLGDALACAHQAGIVHRDIKPQNILISKQGFAKLVDFGLAKMVEPESGADDETRTIDAQTRPGVVMGTVPYMSPEQISGKPADSRSDAFSFGVVLYEALTGVRPFVAKSDNSVAIAILHVAPRPITELRPDVPSPLRAIVEKLLEKDPADRYQSMREAVVDLRRSQRFASPDTPHANVAARPDARGWRLATIIEAAVLASLAVAGWTLYRSELLWRNPLAGAQFTRITDWGGAGLWLPPSYPQYSMCYIPVPILCRISGSSA
jgi:serine/threonine protein kinase